MVIEHIIAGYSIPHNEGAIPLTKEAYDVNNPQKRLSDYSKTIAIPEGKLVNQIFEHAFDVNVDFLTFNPNLKTSYQILQDGVLVIDGYCQLLAIKNVDGLVTYEIAATGKVGDLFEKIKDKYLQDLDLSALDHAWTQANVVSSWTDTIGEGYVYPMIDIGGRSRYNNWKVQDFKPAIYLKQYIDSILSEAGYTYDSTFFETTLYKSLIIPYGSGKILIDNAAILCKEFSAERTSNQTVQCQSYTYAANLANSKLIFNKADFIADYYARVIAGGGVVENKACLEAEFPNEYFNTCNDEYNSATGIYTADSDNKIRLQGALNFDLLYTASDPIVTSMFQNVPVFRFSAHVSCYVVLKRSGVYSIIQTLNLDITEKALDNPISAPSTLIPNNSVAFKTGELSLLYGDEVFIGVGGVSYRGLRGLSSSGGLRYAGIENFAYFDFILKADSTLASKYLETELGLGDTIATNLVIPKQIKQNDLLSSVIKRFNLYIDYDPLNENNLLIETRDVYLTDDKVDIDQIVDRSKDYLIKPLGALDAGRFIFTDPLDKDSINDTYNKVYDETYGQQIINVDNDFITNDKTITTIFAPTPLYSVENNDRVISAMLFVNDNGEVVEATAKIRLLYWGGLLPTQRPWTLGLDLFINNQSFYPYAGHLDNPYAPTFDLNWGVPKQLYYNFNYGKVYTLNYPNTNCYNFFWKKYIEEITDKNSKILECYLALRPYDYNELSFRKNYYIDGSYWRLLSVVDYDATSNQTTKCTFLNVAPKLAFTGEIKAIYGGTGTWEDGTDLPVGDALVKPNGNTGQTQDSLQFGESVKGGTRSLIASDNVSQSLNSVNALIVGSDYSEVNADNVTIINSPYTTASRPDETYINGLFVEKLASIVIPTDVLNSLSLGLEVLPPLPDNEFYQITRGYIRLNGNAPITGYKVSIETSTIVHDLAEIPATFFEAANNVGFLTLSTHASNDIHFGSQLTLKSLTDMAFVDTTLTINLVYRIIRL
jgi:hypothetical protein